MDATPAGPFRNARPFRRTPFSAGAIAAIRLQLAGHPQLQSHRASLAELPLVGGMSSIPERSKALPMVLDHVVPQLDRLHLFLHGYDSIPDGIERANLTVTLGPRDDSYRKSGKLLALAREASPCMYFGFDDDIIYGDGHVRRLRRALLRYGGQALVGIQGTVFRDGAISFTKDRRTLHFPSAQLLDEVVDVVGVGTCAFVSTALPIDPPAWPEGDMDDLMLAIEAESRGLPRIAVARPSRGLTPVRGTQKQSLWAEAKRNETRHNAQLARLLSLIGARAQ